MRHFKTGIPIVGSLAILFGLAGCADESHWGNSSDQKGGISLSLSTESHIKTAKPVFRSGEEESASNPYDLNSYIKVPKPEDFSIKLEKSDQSFSKTWTSLQGFINYTKENFFSTGAYTLTAYYGEKGKQDFGSPYFEASATFNVLSDEVYELNLVAELMNSMVKVNYSDGFKEYMKDYHSRIRTNGRSDELIYTKDETAPAFIEPDNAVLTVHFTTKGKNFTSAVKIGEFAPMAKTLHNITLDIKDSDNGYSQLEVSFDDTLEEENVTIDLTEELLTAAAPIITCNGFSNGGSVDMLAGNVSGSDIKMLVNAAGGVKSAVMTVESNNYRPSWGSQVDLCKATESQKSEIENAGITAIGFGFRGAPSDSYAELDLTQFGKSLPIGRHTISLQVTDNNDAVSDVAKVTLDSQPIAIELVGTPEMAYGTNTVDVTVNYNGNDPLNELNFKTTDDQGNLGDFKILSCEEKTATRTIESKQYILNLQLPANSTAARVTLPLKIYHGGSLKVEGEIDIIVPKYSLQYDAFTDHAFIKIVPIDNINSDVINTMIEKFELELNGSAINTGLLRDTDNGYIAVLNLKPGEEYAVRSCITKGETWNVNTPLSMESELEIPNGDFSELGENVNITGLQVGGQFRVSPVDYQITSSISHVEPAGWVTINSSTAWTGSSNKNTWFIVPSSWLENGYGLMRNVGYNHNGTTPEKSGGAFNTTYYCENSPTESQLNNAAGELFLGSYTFDGKEHRDEGIAFGSRPSAISFDYKYSLKENKSDKGYALIKIISADGTILGTQTFNLEPTENMKTMKVDFKYEVFGKKAAKLIVSFKSSNQNVPPIHIPTGSALNEGIWNIRGNLEIEANNYKAVATGSVLIIDNVKAIYGSNSPASAPKRTTNKKR